MAAGVQSLFCMRTTTALLGLLLLSAAGCRTRPADVALPQPCRVVNETREVLGSSRDSVVQALGAPESTRAVPQPNRHVQGAVDQIHTLRYPSASVVIHEATPVERDLLYQVEVRSSESPLPAAALIGRSREEIEAALGAPSSSHAPGAVWECEAAMGPDVLELTFSNDRVSSATIEYMID